MTLLDSREVLFIVRALSDETLAIKAAAVRVLSQDGGGGMKRYHQLVQEHRALLAGEDPDAAREWLKQVCSAAEAVPHDEGEDRKAGDVLAFEAALG